MQPIELAQALVAIAKELQELAESAKAKSPAVPDTIVHPIKHRKPKLAKMPKLAHPPKLPGQD